MTFFPTRARGQNFLHDRSAATRFAAAALGIGEKDPVPDAVVEIGPGKGAITLALIAGGARVLAVEIDPRLAAITERTARDRGVAGRLRVVVGDAGTMDFRAAIDDFGATPPLPACGNLPFSTASRLLLRLLDQTTPGAGQLFDSLTLTLQREVAARVVAVPNTRDYSALSVVVQQAMRPAIRFEIHPAAFRPRPRVVSSVVRLAPRRDRPEVGDVTRFRALVRGLFRHRRKNLKNSIAALSDPHLRESAAAAAALLGMDATRRPESLTVAEFARLARRAEGSPARPRARPAAC